MSLRDWGDRQDDGRSWLIRLEFGLAAFLSIGSLMIVIVSAVWPIIASAHPGGLAADGCHNDRKNGGRHCHRGPAPQDASDSQQRETYITRIALPLGLRVLLRLGEAIQAMPHTSIETVTVSGVSK